MVIKMITYSLLCVNTVTFSALDNENKHRRVSSIIIEIIVMSQLMDIYNHREYAHD